MNRQANLRHGPGARRLHLALAMNSTGFHPKSWLAAGNREAFWDFEHFAAVAGIAQNAGLDALWLPDIPGDAPPADTTHSLALDPTILLAALAARVPDIGLVPTVSTTFSHPYPIARQFATLAAISRGRAGINFVTSYSPALQKLYGGPDLPDYEGRFARADEYVDLFGKLSGSWTWGAPTGPDADRRMFDESLRSAVRFQGRHFEVDGFLGTPQRPGDGPLISIAGGSDHTLHLAGKYGDVLYTAGLTKRGISEIRETTGTIARGHGRTADAVKIMLGACVILGSSQEEAERRADRFAQTAGIPLDPTVRIGEMLGLDPADLHPDRPLTEAQITLPPSWKRPIGFFRALADVAREERPTVRQLAAKFRADVGHLMLVGTPESVAETMIDWWQDEATDGFLLRFQNLPDDLALFRDTVVPILRKRGVILDRYDRSSLRDTFRGGAGA